jgi:hypothetical protein
MCGAYIVLYMCALPGEMVKATCRTHALVADVSTAGIALHHHIELNARHTEQKQGLLKERARQRPNQASFSFPRM